MARLNLNLNGVLGYLNAVGVGKLDGIAQELEAKAAELGIAPGKVVTPEIQVGHEPTGNVRGIVQFIQGVTADSPKGDKKKLATLLAVVRGRVGTAGLKVGATAPDAQPETEPEPAPEPAPVADATLGPRGRRRRRRQK